MVVTSEAQNYYEKSAVYMNINYQGCMISTKGNRYHIFKHERKSNAYKYEMEKRNMHQPNRSS